MELVGACTRKRIARKSHIVCLCKSPTKIKIMMVITGTGATTGITTAEPVTPMLLLLSLLIVIVAKIDVNVCSYLVMMG